MAGRGPFGNARTGSRGAAAVGPDASEILVAAYWHVGQVVETSISLMHAGDQAGPYRLITHPSSLDTQIELPQVVEVDSGETVVVPVTIRLQDDPRDDQPLGVSIGAVDEMSLGTVGTAQIELPATCEADAVALQRVWPVPRLFLGHVNVSWSAFGAVAEQERREDVNDGRSAPSVTETVSIGEALTIRLAGDHPHRLVGTILDPVGRRGSGRQLESYRIETPLEGTTWRTTFEGTLGAPRREQAFVFDEPVEARMARLVFLSAHEGLP